MQQLIEKLNNNMCDADDLKEAALLLQKNKDIIDSQLRTIQAILQGVPHAEDGSSAVILHMSRLENRIQDLTEELSRRDQWIKEIKEVETSLRWCINAQLYYFKHNNDLERAQGLHNVLQDTPMIQQIVEEYE